MNSLKRRLRDRSKSSNDRADSAISRGRKRQLPSKSNQTKDIPQRVDKEGTDSAVSRGRKRELLSKPNARKPTKDIAQCKDKDGSASAVSRGRKRELSSKPNAQKPTKDIPQRKGKEDRAPVKRVSIVSSETPRSILKKVQSNKENESQNIAEVVIRNCKLTNTLFDMNKKLMEKDESILKLNVQLAEAKVENANLKKDMSEKTTESFIQLHAELTDTKIEKLNLKNELAEKNRDIDELKRIIRGFENEKFCSDLIQLDDSSEGMPINILRT